MTYDKLLKQIEEHTLNRDIITEESDTKALLKEIKELKQALLLEESNTNNDSFEQKLIDPWDELLLDVQSQEYSTGKKALEHHFKTDKKHIEIIPLGDLHVGHKSFNLNKLQSVLDYIIKTPNAYTLLVGDQAETATKVSIGKGVFEEDYHIKKQIEVLEKLFKPLATQGKLLGIHPGNHEFRIEALTGIDPMEWLARWLEVPYLGYQAYFSWYVNDIPYTCWSNHGKSGAATFGGKVNASQKQREVHNCDLSLSGHIHEPTWSHKSFFEIDPTSLEVIKKTNWFVTVGGFLDYFGGYPEMKALSPTLVRPIRISLFADTKFIKID